MGGMTHRKAHLGQRLEPRDETRAALDGAQQLRGNFAREEDVRRAVRRLARPILRQNSVVLRRDALYT